MRKATFVMASVLTACLVFGGGFSPVVFADKDEAETKPKAEKEEPKSKFNFGKKTAATPPAETPKPETSAAPDSQAPEKDIEASRATLEKQSSGEPFPATILPSGPASRQIPEAWKKIHVYYWGKSTLNIGYTVEDKGAGVQTVELWMTADAGITWKCVISHNTVNPPFVLQISNDGVYGFKTVASDKAGFTENKPASGTLPDLVIVVDTVPPKINFAPLEKSVLRGGEKVPLAWSIDDDSMKDDSFRLEYSLDDGATWFPVLEMFAIDKNGRGKLIWNVPNTANVAKALLRILAADHAGNTAAQTLRPPFAISIDPPKCRVNSPAFTDKHDFNVTIESDKTSPVEPVKVTLFYTTDEGKTWLEGDTVNAAKESLMFRAAADGKIGFVAVSSDAFGNSATPPTANTAPQCVTIVDSLPPAIKLKNFDKRASYQGGRSQNIEWIIQEPNMSKPTVKIEFSPDGGKTWQIIAEKHPNTGKYLWNIPKEDINKAKIRISATDDYNHRGEAVSEEAFLIDSKPPVSIPVFEVNEGAQVARNVTPAEPVVTPQPVRTPVATPAQPTPPVPVKSPEPVTPPVPTPTAPNPPVTVQPPVKTPVVTPTVPVKTPAPPKTPAPIKTFEPPNKPEPVTTPTPIIPSEPIKTSPPEKKTPIIEKTPAATPVAPVTPEKTPVVDKTPAPAKTSETGQKPEVEKTPQTNRVDTTQIVRLKIDKITPLVKSGRYTDALAQLKELETDYPENYSVIIVTIDVLQKQKGVDNQETISAYFAKAMEMNKFDRQLLKKAGIYYYNVKDYDKAEECFDKACHLAGAGAQEFMFLGQTRYFNAKNLEAETALKDALKKAFEENNSGIQAQCYWYLAEIAAQNNNTKESLGYWKKAEEKYGPNTTFGKRARERYSEQLKKSK